MAFSDLVTKKLWERVQQCYSSYCSLGSRGQLRLSLTEVLEMSFGATDIALFSFCSNYSWNPGITHELSAEYKFWKVLQGEGAIAYMFTQLYFSICCTFLLNNKLWTAYGSEGVSKYTKPQKLFFLYWPPSFHWMSIRSSKWAPFCFRTLANSTSRPCCKICMHC